MTNSAEDLKIIFENGHDKLMIADDPRGKMLHYISKAEDDAGDVFTIGISAGSLDKLRERSARKVFSWTIKDGSLEVNGKEGKWELVVERQDNHQKCRLFLSDVETNALKQALFS